MEKWLSREELKQLVNSSIKEFNQLVLSLSKEDFERNPRGKWSAGQDLHHLVKSNRMYGLVFSAPRILLQWLYGFSNRTSRSLKQLEDKYAEKASKGKIEAPAYLVPRALSFANRGAWLARHEMAGRKLMRSLDRFTDEDLEKRLMGHPLFGKVTIREMFMSIAVHIQHHHAILKKKLVNDGLA